MNRAYLQPCHQQFPFQKITKSLHWLRAEAIKIPALNLQKKKRKSTKEEDNDEEEKKKEELEQEQEEQESTRSDCQYLLLPACLSEREDGQSVAEESNHSAKRRETYNIAL